MKIVFGFLIIPVLAFGQNRIATISSLSVSTAPKINKNAYNSQNVLRAVGVKSNLYANKLSPFDMKVSNFCRESKDRTGRVSINCDLESMIKNNREYLTKSSRYINKIKILQQNGMVVKNPRTGRDLLLDFSSLRRTSLPPFSRLLFFGKKPDGKVDYMASKTLTLNPKNLNPLLSEVEFDPFIDQEKNNEKVEQNSYRICVRGEYDSIDLTVTNEYYDTLSGNIAYRGLRYKSGNNVVYLDEYGCANFANVNNLNGKLTLMSELKIEQGIKNMSAILYDIHKTNDDNYNSYEDFIDIIKTKDGVSFVENANYKLRETEINFNTNQMEKGKIYYLLVPNSDFFTGVYGAWGFGFYRFVYRFGLSAGQKTVYARPCYDGYYNYGSCSTTYSPFKQVYTEISEFKANVENYSYAGVWNIPVVSEDFYGLAHEIGHSVEKNFLLSQFYESFYPTPQSYYEAMPTSGFTKFHNNKGLCDWKGLGSHAAHSSEPVVLGIREGVAHWLSWLVFNETSTFEGNPVKCIDTETGELSEDDSIHQRCVDLWKYYKTPSHAFPNIPLEEPNYLQIASEQKYPYGIQLGPLYYSGMDSMMKPIKDDLIENNDDFSDHFNGYHGGAINHDEACGFKQNKNQNVFFVSEMGIQRFAVSTTILLNDALKAGKVIQVLYSTCGPSFEAGNGMTEKCVNSALASDILELNLYQRTVIKYSILKLGWIWYPSNEQG